MDRNFGNWINWAHRADLPDINRPGVYVLARLDAGVPPTVDPLSAEVIYIGLTGRSFSERFSEFVRSASKRIAGHSGGWTFSALYCNSEPSELPPWLFVAASSFEIDDADRIEEYKEQLLNGYIARHGRAPACNIKVPA
jgi:hypothetical protein